MKLNEAFPSGQIAKEMMIDHNTVADPPKDYVSERKKKVCPKCNGEMYLVNLYAKLRPHWTVTKWIIVGKWCPKCGTFYSQDQIDGLPDNDKLNRLLKEWDEMVSFLYEE